MARVTITVEDAPGGTEPTTEELGAAVQRWTPAQASAFGAVMEMAGLGATFALFIQDDPVI